MKVVPSSTIAVELMIAIEFTKGLSVSSPTWRASCWYFTSKPTQGYPEVVDCKQGVVRSGTRWCKQHKVQTGSDRELRNTLHPVWWFVLSEVSICFREVPVRTYIAWRIGLYETLYRYELRNTSRILLKQFPYILNSSKSKRLVYMTYGYGTCRCPIPYFIQICATLGIRDPGSHIYSIGKM